MAQALPKLASPSIAPGQREQSSVRKKLSAPALRSFFRVADKWMLSVYEQRALLGFPVESTFHKYKSGKPGVLSFDMLTRISLILGIYKALHILYPQPELADRWIKLPNSNTLFAGQPALALMTVAGIDGLYQVRRLLDGRRG